METETAPPRSGTPQSMTGGRGGLNMGDRLSVPRPPLPTAAKHRNGSLGTTESQKKEGQRIEDRCPLEAY